MKKDVEKEILQAFQNFSKENQIANELKKFLDKQYGPSWNVIVGKHFGSHVIT